MVNFVCFKKESTEIFDLNVIKLSIDLCLFGKRFQSLVVEYWKGFDPLWISCEQDLKNTATRPLRIFQNVNYIWQEGDTR